MNVFANTVVSLVFKLYDERNQIIEETSDPIAYLHGGYGNTLAGIEAAAAASPPRAALAERPAPKR